MSLTSGLHDWLTHLGTRPSWDHTHQNLQELDSILPELHRIEQDGGREAAQEYLVAMSPTAPNSLKLLVVSYLDDFGRRDEALTWLRRLAETGDPGCIAQYAERLIVAGRSDEGMVRLRRALEGGGFNSRVNGIPELMIYLHELGDRAAASDLRRFGIDPGGATAAPWDV